MGIIQRQSIKTSVVSLAGVVIAGFSTLFIYKLDESIYGTAQYIYGVAAFLTPFASFGISASVLKFFPDFKSDIHKYFNSSFLFLGMIMCVFLCVFLIFQNSFYRILQTMGIGGDGYIQSHITIVIMLAFAISINQVLISHAANQLRIVIPELINTVLYKLFLAVLILSVYFGVASEQIIASSILLFFTAVTISLLLYLKLLKAVRLSAGYLRLHVDQVREIMKYSGFSGLNIIGSTLAFRVDVIMVGAMLSMEAVGIYSILMFLTNVIEIPRRSISKIASPIISNAWKSSNVLEISGIYKKSSINIMIAAIGMFLVIWFSLPILDWLATGVDRFYIGRYVFLFLALGKLIDSLMSVNSEIIIYSKYYKANLYFVLFLGISNVIFNYLLISKFQLLGAAMATSLSYFLFNLLKFVYIWLRFRISPFTYKTIRLIVLSILLFALGQVTLAYFSSIFANLFLVTVLMVVYASSVYLFSISEDANLIFSRLLTKIQNLRHKKRP